MRRFLAAITILIPVGLTITPALGAQAKPDTVAKPAVIYTYPGGRSTTDSVRVLQRPFETTPRRQAKVPRITMVRPETLHVQIPDSVVRWMKDTVRVRLGDQRKDMVIGEPRVNGDTAWVPAKREPQNIGGDRMYVFAIEHRFERRGGVWALTNQFTMQHLHGSRTPASPFQRDSLDVKSRPYVDASGPGSSMVSYRAMAWIDDFFAEQAASSWPTTERPAPRPTAGAKAASRT